MEKIAAITLVLLAGACTSDYQYRDVDLTIVEVLNDKSALGCMGSERNKVLLSFDGTSESICGYYGEPGTKLLHAQASICARFRK